MKFMFGLSTLALATLKQPLQTLQIKWEVKYKYVVKEVFMRLPSCVCLWYCVVAMLNESEDEYTTLSDLVLVPVLQGLRMNLVTVNCSFKHHNTTATKRTKKDAGMERSKKKKQEQTSKKKRKGRKRNRPTRKEQKKKNKEKCWNWKK